MPKVVAVSGGFDPIHVGHVRMMKEARALGDELVVILNNDNWLRAKKGRAFMPQNERKELIEGLGCVDRVLVSFHGEAPEDMSVCAELRELKPDVFANGGDRKSDNVPELVVCTELGCETAWGVGAGGKVQSSSWLLGAHAKDASGESMAEVQDKILAHLQERGWDKLRPGDIAKSIIIEGAELLEHFQWWNPSLEEVRESEERMREVRKETADIMIYSFELAALLGFDAREAVLEKLARAGEKYPADLMKKISKEGSGAGTQSAYLQIKKEWREKNLS